MRMEKILKRYFYITIHFVPDYEEKIISKKQDDIYINVETGELYRKRQEQKEEFRVEFLHDRMKIFSAIILNGGEFLQRLSIRYTIILNVDPAHVMTENGNAKIG